MSSSLFWRRLIAEKRQKARPTRLESLVRRRWADTAEARINLLTLHEADF